MLTTDREAVMRAGVIRENVPAEIVAALQRAGYEAEAGNYWTSGDRTIQVRTRRQ
jgi:hypothetical protein